MLTIKRGTHSTRGGNLFFFFFFLTYLCHFFDLGFSKSSCSQAFAPACGALVTYPFPQSSVPFSLYTLKSYTCVVNDPCLVQNTCNEISGNTSCFRFHTVSHEDLPKFIWRQTQIHRFNKS